MRAPKAPPPRPAWYRKPDDTAYLTACQHSPKECMDIAMTLPLEDGLRLISYWSDRGYDVLQDPGMALTLATIGP